MSLTIGMAVYDDFSGVYFTLQALRLYHPKVELIVVDNKGDDRLKNWLGYWCKPVRYIKANEVIGTSYPRDKVFHEANGEWVICIDSHVMLVPGAVDSFIAWTLMNPDCVDLLQGPMLYDNLTACTTHMKPVWRSEMFGIWSEPEFTEKLPSEPFEIPMHGLGLFGCRKDAWLGFNSSFNGFGGEEGYIHEKYRKAGRKTLCLPFLQWLHLFESSRAYPLNVQDRIRNYILGWTELGLDTAPISEHFGKRRVQCLTV